MMPDIKILYVEDENEIRDELIEILELDFNDIFSACNGEEGLEMFEKHQPDLVISDIQMPKMDGLTMSRQILERNPKTAIIITTAFNEQKYIDEANELNISHFISKPISIMELHQSIKSCFSDEDSQ